uniref:DUF104 domain-containing protein n=1 Tax=Candidatus Kentrum sp. TUN TaxID=2126343 RepID=A0A451AX38_9GAMM|nr:MAG: Protein of unknown function DUF104 [Candidatus Kentron sp. TUN]VFK70598.1 MAG: Protein of unknown function DUF104 [Candidatus Kentron sp. TUN]
MPQSIMAVYEHGLLRPLEPLTLTESQQVKIQILSEPLADKNGHVVESPQISSRPLLYLRAYIPFPENVHTLRRLALNFSISCKVANATSLGR